MKMQWRGHELELLEVSNKFYVKIDGINYGILHQWRVDALYAAIGFIDENEGN